MDSPIFTSYNSDRSRGGNTDVCINLYPEHTDGEKGPEIGMLISVSGKKLLATIGTGPIRAGKKDNNGLLYLVSGNSFYSVTTSYVATMLGNIGSNNGAVSIVSSPTQTGVVDGTGMWVWSKNALTWTQTVPNTTSCTNPTSAAYQDGFCIVNSNDNQVYQTNYNDLSTMVSGSPLTPNNAFVQNNAESVVTVFGLKEEVWIFKTNQTEVWINQGAAGFAFVPLTGVSIPVGCSAPASVAQLGESVAWLGGSDQGNCIVYMSVGYQAKPILNESLAQRFQSFATISDAIAWSYQKDFHYFYVITFPTQGESWAYDLKTGYWTQRAGFSNGVFNRDWANCSFFFNNMNIIGDYKSGNLYSLDDTVYDDAGTTRKWLRSWRALPPNMPQGGPMSFDSLQILMETGNTVPDGTNPQIMLRWSDDSGNTWSGQFQVPFGKTGQTAWRAIKNRLGSTKIGTGLDRIFEISGTDPILIKILGAEWFGGPS